MSLMLRALRGIAVASLCAVLLLAAWTLALIPFTPAVDGLGKARSERPSVLLATDGSVVATFRRVNQEWVPLQSVPAHVVDALISTEDNRFWEHHGIDWQRTLAAAVRTLLGSRQGASTITQQLARNFFPEKIGRAPTLTRKLKELITAVKLERAYSKREILESYLNTVPFLYNAYGIEMAARTYFDKPARDLSVLEGATLVGMLKGTSVYNPVLNPERARERRNVVLAQMVRRGRLDAKTFDGLRGQPLRLAFERQDLGVGPAPHFAEAVRRWLADWAETSGYNIYADGLVVQSTLDPRLQQMANQAVARQIDALQAVENATRAPVVDAFIRESPEYARLLAGGGAENRALAQLRGDAAFMKALRARKMRLESGFVAIDPHSGQVRAWVGSRDFQTDAFDHVAQARRQPGSTFKPFVYGAALEAGMAPDREFEDRPVAIRLADGSVWRPGDSGGTSGRKLTLEDGLVFSRNTITAQVIEAVGPRKVVQFAQRMGVRESPLDAVPSLALGTSPVTLLEMVSAYGTIAALGEYRPPALVTRVSDQHGKVLAEFAPQAAASGEAAPGRVLDAEVAARLVDMLRGVVDRGTGRDIRQVYGIDADVGGKTGTTQNNTDGWFILIHPELVAGAWVGFNDPRVTLRSDFWGQGAHNALRVVGDFTRQALSARALDPGAEFPRRGGFVAAVKHFGEQLKRWLGFGGP